MQLGICVGNCKDPTLHWIWRMSSLPIMWSFSLKLLRACFILLAMHNRELSLHLFSFVFPPINNLLGMYSQEFSSFESGFVCVHGGCRLRRVHDVSVCAPWHVMGIRWRHERTYFSASS